jgi:transcription initiation factor IIE alpha subunit
MALELKPLRQKKLYHQMKKQLVRHDKRVMLYLRNQNWLKIRKQKDRRRRRVLMRLWRMKQLTLLKTGRLSLPTLAAS